MARKRRGRPRAPVAVIVTCEHGGNLVPPELAEHFSGRRKMLDSHRGWDRGALELGGAMAAAVNAPYCFALVSRLVVDLNRSIQSPTLHGPMIAALDQQARNAVVARHHHPYRDHVESRIKGLLDRAEVVLHISSHTFTPIRNGRRRKVDIGVLFDPDRPLESLVADEWRTRLVHHLPRLRVRANQPYRGTDDGLTTTLRGLFPRSRYLGIELEVNQRFPRGSAARWEQLREAIAAALSEAVECSFGLPIENPLPVRTARSRSRRSK